MLDFVLFSQKILDFVAPTDCDVMRTDCVHSDPKAHQMAFFLQPIDDTEQIAVDCFDLQQHTMPHDMIPNNGPPPQNCVVSNPLLPPPIHSATILDLNDDCLEAICRNLNEYELFTLRDSEKSFEFDLKYWSEDNGIGNLVKILEYFGDCMSRVCIDKCFLRFVRKKSVPQSFLSKHLKNVRYLCMYHAGRIGVRFISRLEHVQVYEVIDCAFDRMPLHARWPGLKRLSVIRHGDERDENDRQEFEDFLLRHKGIQKLYLDLHKSRPYGEPDMMKFIAIHLHEIIELEFKCLWDCDLEMNRYSNMLNTLQKNDLSECGYSNGKSEWSPDFFKARTHNPNRGTGPDVDLSSSRI